MGLKQLGWVLPILLLFAVSAKADTAAVYVNGTYRFSDHGSAIGPYGGTLNGQNASFYCVDFSHNIDPKTSWTAVVTTLTNPTGYANTRLKDQTTYLEIAFHVSKMMLAAPDKTTKG